MCAWQWRRRVSTGEVTIRTSCGCSSLLKALSDGMYCCALPFLHNSRVCIWGVVKGLLQLPQNHGQLCRRSTVLDEAAACLHTVQLHHKLPLSSTLHLFIVQKLLSSEQASSGGKTWSARDYACQGARRMKVYDGRHLEVQPQREVWGIHVTTFWQQIAPPLPAHC